MLGRSNPPVDWRSLDRAGLDAAYNNGAAVKDSAAIVARWDKSSAELRQRHAGTIDLAYGPRPRNRIDFLKADAPNAPTLVFIHGGYWQMRSKESFTFTATGPLSAGINVALAGYTLAPEASLDEMVKEVRLALDWLAKSLPGLGANPEKIFLSGWSAGAHLAVMAIDHPSVRGCLAISGLYDLEPIRHCYVNDKLGLDEAAARRNSPIHHLPSKSPPLTVTVGGDELPLMHQQSTDYADACSARGLPVTFREVAGANHFSILDDMARPDGKITGMVRDLVKAAPS
jgi:arylformamidase